MLSSRYPVQIVCQKVMERSHQPIERAVLLFSQRWVWRFSLRSVATPQRMLRNSCGAAIKNICLCSLVSLRPFPHRDPCGTGVKDPERVMQMSTNPATETSGFSSGRSPFRDTSLALIPRGCVPGSMTYLHCPQLITPLIYSRVISSLGSLNICSADPASMTFPRYKNTT